MSSQCIFKTAERPSIKWLEKIKESESLKGLESNSTEPGIDSKGLKIRIMNIKLIKWIWIFW